MGSRSHGGAGFSSGCCSASRGCPGTCGTELSDRRTGLGAHSGATDRAWQRALKAALGHRVSGHGVGLQCLFPSPSQMSGHRCKGGVGQTRAVPTRPGRGVSPEEFRTSPSLCPVFTVAFNGASAGPSCGRSSRSLLLQAIIAAGHYCSGYGRCSGRSGTARVPQRVAAPAAEGGAATALPSACLHRQSCTSTWLPPTRGKHALHRQGSLG